MTANLNHHEPTETGGNVMSGTYAAGTHSVEITLTRWQTSTTRKVTVSVNTTKTVAGVVIEDAAKSIAFPCGISSDWDKVEYSIR